MPEAGAEETYSIRPAHPDDRAAIASIYNEGVAEGNATFDDFEVGPERYDKYFESDGRRALICAEDESVVIGWASVDPVSDRHAYRVTAEGSIYVTSTVRRGGLGLALSVAMGQAARELGYHSIIGQILSTNPAGLSMNLRDHYRIVGEISEAGLRDGKRIGLVVVQKMLGDK